MRGHLFSRIITTYHKKHITVKVIILTRRASIATTTSHCLIGGLGLHRHARISNGAAQSRKLPPQSRDTVQSSGRMRQWHIRTNTVTQHYETVVLPRYIYAKTTQISIKWCQIAPVEHMTRKNTLCTFLSQQFGHAFGQCHNIVVNSVFVTKMHVYMPRMPHTFFFKGSFGCDLLFAVAGTCWMCYVNAAGK